ncbi:acetyltransferase [Fructobacillus pseudoficulneus]|uniref:Acetyltransferase n=1 Tax=Fructobacillus pseudoficulneus TaxID=220714 RepID=A0A3F3GW87_9LACO|nr:GNAT family protein [Fructobacillus pseudoficulneus]GAP03026.1 acetyltransferase [Fructobacillus pseudoficulneus]SEH41985.1 Protein N-acetyltransferase, RimJ/RimL family [Fructobacillus pseudoficulneus]
MFIGKNVKLSHYHEGDGKDFADWQWDDAFINLLSDDVIHPFSAENWEKIFRNSANDNENVEFTVRKVVDDSLIGFVSLTNISVRNHSCELGIGFPKEEDRSKGYGQETLSLILDYGFNNLNMHKIKLSVFPFNTAAVKAYTKVGFIKEGTSKNEVFYDGKWVDSDHYAIFQEDWFASRQ